MKKILLMLGLYFAASIVNAEEVLSEAQKVKKGKDLSSVCAACHNVDGNATMLDYPTIAGQSHSYLVKQLQDIKTDKRNVLEMSAILKAFSDDDLSNIALYFSKQTAKKGVADASVAELGEQLYRFGKANGQMPACIGCHAVDGSGIATAPYPKLSGQKASYIAKQLKAFRELERTNDGEASAMRDVASKLSDREIKALSEYIQGLN